MTQAPSTHLPASQSSGSELKQRGAASKNRTTIIDMIMSDIHVGRSTN
jgi:hypothetical protein